MLLPMTILVMIVGRAHMSYGWNPKWIRDSHETLDYFERFVDKLPVNPPGLIAEGDVVLDSVDILNWQGEDGLEFRPRLRDNVRRVSTRPTKIRLTEEAPEIDEEIDCD
jgi:hypothetical protein